MTAESTIVVQICLDVKFAGTSRVFGTFGSQIGYLLTTDHFQIITIFCILVLIIAGATFYYGCRKILERSKRLDF